MLVNSSHVYMLGAGSARSAKFSDHVFAMEGLLVTSLRGPS